MSRTTSILEEGEVELEPITIKDYRWIKQGSNLVTEALVQCKMLPPEDATWEKVNQLAQQSAQP